MVRAPSLALPGLAVLAAACATFAGGSGPAGGTWVPSMQAIDAQFALVRHELDQRPQGDLEAAARAARTAAELVAEGYGRHERKDVPGFAALARACESWLLGLAFEADQGHGEIAREQLGQAERCVVCHDRCGMRRP